MPDFPRFVAVIDDELSVCKAFARLLRVAKYEVETFLNGSDFLASLSSRVPDCIVLDLNMPDMNGFEILSRLAAEPVAKKVAVVIVTAHDSPESQQLALARGVSAYLRKPVEAKHLIDAIRQGIAAQLP